MIRTKLMNKDLKSIKL